MSYFYDGEWGHGSNLFPQPETHNPFHASAGQKVAQLQTGPGPVPCSFWALPSEPCPQTPDQEGPQPVPNPSHPAWRKILHPFVLAVSLQKSPPSIQIMTSNFPLGLGEQGSSRDINTTWKIAARRKTVLDLSSDTTRKSLFFLTGAWQLQQLRIQASICSRCLRWGYWSCKALALGIQLSYSPPPTLSRYLQSLPPRLYPAHCRAQFKPPSSRRPLSRSPFFPRCLLTLSFHSQRTPLFLPNVRY